MPGRIDRELTAAGRRLQSTLRDVWDGIRAQPGRVGLSFMAIAVGIASLTVLITVLGGLQEKSRQIVKELGVDVVGILAHRGTGRNPGTGLEERHAALLALNLPDSSVSTVRVHRVPTLGTQELLSVVATDSSLIRIRQWHLHDGRFLDHRDVENRERNAVVSRSLSTLWNWEVGNLIMLRNAPFKIVGVVEVGGGALDAELGDSGLMLGERVVFVPKTVAPQSETNHGDPPMNDATRNRMYHTGPRSMVDAIFLRVATSMSLTQAVSTAKRLLSQPDYRVKHVSFVSPESLVRGVKKLQNTISLTVGSITVLCLLLGGTTLMGLMVANVRDRVTEIGLRRALGASRRDIVVLFVTDACLITGAAAVVATLGTHLLLMLGSHAFPIPLRLGWASILIPLTVAFVLGIVFSYWPAHSAARIMPSEALRNE